MAPRRRAPLTGLAISIACLLPAISATAGELTIQFDGLTSSATIFGTLTAPPDGTIAPAAVWLKIPANGLLSPVGGPAVISGFEIYIDFAGNAATDANVNGSLFLETNVPAPAVLSPGGGLITVTSPFSLNAGFFLGCTGVDCSGLGLPVSPTNNSSLMLMPGLMGLTNVETLGSAEMDIPFSFTWSGVPITIGFIGKEVMRTYVPEPGTGTLLAFGCLAVILLGAPAWATADAQRARRASRKLE